MARCAGVQNVSRPIERCHDTSQIKPMVALVAARANATVYHGSAVPCPLSASCGGAERAPAPPTRPGRVTNLRSAGTEATDMGRAYLFSAPLTMFDILLPFLAVT